MVSCDAAGSKQKKKKKKKKMLLGPSKKKEKKKKSVILDKNKFGNPMFAIQDQVIHFTFVPVFKKNQGWMTPIHIQTFQITKEKENNKQISPSIFNFL